MKELKNITIKYISEKIESKRKNKKKKKRF
jgi:hypothetical protein